MSSVRIDFWVFEATTARVKAQGTCYQGAYRTGGVVMQPGTSGTNNPAQAQQACAQCRQQLQACTKNYAGKTCKTEYDICMKGCQKK